MSSDGQEGSSGFIDAEAHSGDSDFSFRMLVLNHLSKISTLCTKEFRTGYWQKKPISIGGGIYLSEIYVEDQRDAYINSIDYLHDLLIPHFDKTASKEVEIIESEQANSFKSFCADKKSKSDWTDQKLQFKRRVFQKLNLLLKRLNYFESGGHDE